MRNARVLRATGGSYHQPPRQEPAITPCQEPAINTNGSSDWVWRARVIVGSCARGQGW
ncbi:MAG TPA: hypothetical protein VKV27_12925 [Solirubrobacteraceae bacterium]|nr:hypothetical protein [Solirubrobacteraceae bacterium]